MGLVKGPFDLDWGNNTLLNVSEIAIDFKQDSNDYSTVDNRTYTVDGAITTSVTLTLLWSDVPSLAIVLPQYLVAMGGHLSSGETVTSANGAIDILAASCDTNPVYDDLDITACGTGGEVLRLKNARTKIDSMEFTDNAVRTVKVQFLGEPDAGIANIQFFAENGITPIS